VPAGAKTDAKAAKRVSGYTRQRSRGAHRARRRAAAIADTRRRGVEAELIDLSTLRPLESETRVRSIRKTNRFVVVAQGPLSGAWAAEVVEVVVEQRLDDLDDASRIATTRSPILSMRRWKASFCRVRRIAEEIHSPLG
jgi:pyruvate/2-oxoglutarate/acetoin dehydrogenase E1 component